MRRTIKLGLVTLITLAAAAAAPVWAQEDQTSSNSSASAVQMTASAAVNLPVRRVVLYSSGVGFFEHEGQVTGDAQTQLLFKTEQINDILKSLVLQDLNGGTVSTVTYPSQDPLDKTLKSFQIDISSNPPMADLLNQLRGAAVTITLADEKIDGTILGVEERDQQAGTGANAQIIHTWVLNIIDGTQIRSIDLDDLRGVQLDDPQLQSELMQALAAVAQSRDKDKKPVVIDFNGSGTRTVRIGYVTETPVWKTSYRLLLPSPGSKDSPQLQGWAIIDNQTDNDWNDVQLNLVGGRPISFVEDLYQPLYIPRPVVVPPLYASLMPQLYQGGMSGEAEMMPAQAPEAAAELQSLAAQKAAFGVMTTDENTYTGASTINGNAPANYSQSILSIAAAGKVGQMFQYSVDHVTLPRQQSAMIPIITSDIQADRVSIYNAGVLQNSPLYGVRLTNNTGNYLLQGPVTVLDDNNYAGDAQIDDVPAGQNRLLSYGIDQDVYVDSTHNTQSNDIVTASIVKGVLQVTYKQVYSQDFDIDNKGSTDKTMIIEYPFHQGWQLDQPAKPLETTDALYRFQTDAPAGKNSKLTVQEEQVYGQGVAILPADIGSLLYFSRNGKIPQDVRDALAKAIGLRDALSDTQQQISQDQQQEQNIATDQDRIRRDMQVAPRSSAYYTRLLDKLNDQENTLESLDQDIATLQDKATKQQAALNDYLSNLNVD
ncbi:MAG TPA: hypothetical protein VMG59_01350 [Phycisphaerae bacterium]|nr:hypothetical protein [Phycisphaerae bacterium]